MPFIFLALGIMLTVAGVRGTQAQLFSLLKSDFTGNGTFKGSYIAWIVAIAIVGGLGYFKSVRPISNAFLVLVIVVLFLDNKGVWANLVSALNMSSTPSPVSAANPTITNPQAVQTANGQTPFYTLGT